MKKLFLFLFLISCSSTNTNYNTNNKVFNLNEDLTFDKFNELLIEYAKTNPYPNIDQ